MTSDFILVIEDINVIFSVKSIQFWHCSEILHIELQIQNLNGVKRGRQIGLPNYKK